MTDDAKQQPTGTRNPARHEGVDPDAGVGAPTPDSVETTDPVGRRAQTVNGAVQGAGAGAGGGAPEDFDGDTGSSGSPVPPHAETASPDRGGDARNHGSA